MGQTEPALAMRESSVVGKWMEGVVRDYKSDAHTIVTTAQRKHPYCGVIMNEKQREVMLIAQEECAEVVQAISKCFRFGFDDSYENETNQQRLEKEVGDLMAMIELMVDNDIVNRYNIQIQTVAKKEKLKVWSNIFKDDSEIIN